jgi:hypothetical protein
LNSWGSAASTPATPSGFHSNYAMIVPFPQRIKKPAKILVWRAAELTAKEQEYWKFQKAAEKLPTQQLLRPSNPVESTYLALLRLRNTKA